MNNKNKMMQYAIDKIYGRTDITEDQKQDLLLQSIEYLNKTNAINYNVSMYRLAASTPKESEEPFDCYIEDLNLSYNMEINDEKILLDYLYKQIEKETGTIKGRGKLIFNTIYLEGQTRTSLAEYLGVTKNRITQIERKCLRTASRIIGFDPTITEGTKYHYIVERRFEAHRKRVAEEQVRYAQIKEREQKNREEYEKIRNERLNKPEQGYDLDLIFKDIEEDEDMVSFFKRRDSIIEFYQKYFAGQVIDNRKSKEDNNHDLDDILDLD